MKLLLTLVITPALVFGANLTETAKEKIEDLNEFSALQVKHCAQLRAVEFYSPSQVAQAIHISIEQRKELNQLASNFWRKAFSNAQINATGKQFDLLTRLHGKLAALQEKHKEIKELQNKLLEFEQPLAN